MHHFNPLKISKNRIAKNHSTRSWRAIHSLSNGLVQKKSSNVSREKELPTKLVFQLSTLISQKLTKNDMKSKMHILMTQNTFFKCFSTLCKKRSAKLWIKCKKRRRPSFEHNRARGLSLTELIISVFHHLSSVVQTSHIISLISLVCIRN